MPEHAGGLPPRSRATYDRRSVHNSNQIAQLPPHLLGQTQGFADPFNSALGHQISLAAVGTIRFGRVISALPYVNWYRVQLDAGDADLPCCKLSSQGSLSPIGVRETSPVPPHSAVYVYRPPQHVYGFILGIIPELTEDGNLVCPDWIVQGGNTGFQREGYYAEMLSLLSQEGGILDFSAGRPLDATCLDWGYMAETGLGIHIDPFLAYLRVDEQCGLYLFYHDQAARLAGSLLELRSLAHEESLGEDEGEGQVFRGESPYPWEMLGALQPKGIEIAREVSAADVQFNKPYGTLEPRVPDLQAFYRYREYGGYLGQGKIREVAVPPADEPIHTYGSGQPALGVFREQIGLDGSYGLQSARQVVIAKRALIPVAKRKRLAPDPKGDNPENYKASGYYGQGPEHKVGELTNDSEAPHVLAAAAVHDAHAYLFNWLGLHPFHYHHEDFELPEEDGLPTLRKLTGSLGFDDLKTEMFLPGPQPKKVRVDHRYGELDFYETNSGLTLLPDGGVVIHDGYGSEIRMTGGSIFLSCPGDVFLQPGRNAIQMAGRDVVLRARNGVDISATEKDVRIKAERNLQILGGAHGEGGILIESKANSPLHEYVNKVGEDVQGSGIVLKATRSEVVAMGQEVYLRTGSSDGGQGSGPITLDADRGRAAIRTTSSTFDRFVEGSVNDTFGIEQPRAVNQFSSQANRFAGQLQANQGLLVASHGAYVRGGVFISEGHVSSEQARGYQGKVTQLPPRSVASLQNLFNGMLDEQKKLLDTQSKAYANSIETRFYSEGRVGNADVQRSLGFSFRTATQYQTEHFQLPECGWQQLAGAAGTGQVWHEKSVSVGDQELMPYPGKEAWKDKPTLLKFDHTLFDPETGVDRPRTDDAYSKPELRALDPVVPDDSYLVI